MPIHESGQMYLETIYILSRRNPYVRAIDVGEQLGYSKPSVSRAMALLKKDGYVTVGEDGGITLTESGLQVAQTMYTRHTAGGGRKDRHRGRLPDRTCNQRKILCGHAAAPGAEHRKINPCVYTMRPLAGSTGKGAFAVISDLPGSQ